MRTVDGHGHEATVRQGGLFIRTFDGQRFRYYFVGVRIPWVVWAMFS